MIFTLLGALIASSTLSRALPVTNVGNINVEYQSFNYTGDAPWPASPEAMGSIMTCPYGDITPESNPVLLVHGTGSKGNESWSIYAEALRTDGYDPCWVDLPYRSMEDNQISAGYVAYNLLRLSSLAAKPVAVIAHSSGCPVTQWGLRWWPSTGTSTRAFVALAPDFQGVYFSYITGFCDMGKGSMHCNPSLWQQAKGSHFMAALDEYARYEIVPTTVAWTHLDQIVWPAHETSKLANSTSISVQSVCALHVVDHLGMVLDPVGYSIALDALSHDGVADEERISKKVCFKLLHEGVTFNFEATVAAGYNDIMVGIWGEELKVAQEPALASYVPPFNITS